MAAAAYATVTWIRLGLWRGMVRRDIVLPEQWGVPERRYTGGKAFSLGLAMVAIGVFVLAALVRFVLLVYHS